MKKAILFALLLLASTFLFLPSSTHARALAEKTLLVTGGTPIRNKPAIPCPPSSPYSACLPPRKPPPGN
ncbi:hypothetical protein K1719_001301 [Acacia pycnantha]|nr:hypothetical protein K1719_001301 [Acacia pycnantha]